MKSTSIIDTGLKFFDRYFVHIFISGTHLFFLCLAAWLGRWDLAALGLVMFVLSFVAFQGVMGYGGDEAGEDNVGDGEEGVVKGLEELGA